LSKNGKEEREGQEKGEGKRTRFGEEYQIEVEVKGTAGIYFFHYSLLFFPPPINSGFDILPHFVFIIISGYILKAKWCNFRLNG